MRVATMGVLALSIAASLLMVSSLLSIATKPVIVIKHVNVKDRILVFQKEFDKADEPKVRTSEFQQRNRAAAVQEGKDREIVHLKSLLAQKSSKHAAVEEEKDRQLDRLKSLLAQAQVNLTQQHLLHQHEKEEEQQSVLTRADSHSSSSHSKPAPLCGPFDADTAPGGKHFEGFDVVITWYNATGLSGGCHDEMRFLMRSIVKYGLWEHVRKVWIVVADTSVETCAPVPPPDYFREGPKLKFVYHREIFADAGLSTPTDNRNAITASIPNIPGLADWFFRFDDDQVLARKFVLGDWYDVDHGQLVYHYSPHEECAYSGVGKASEEVEKVAFKMCMWNTNSKLNTLSGPRKEGGGCRKCPEKTDHSAMLWNKCLSKHALSLFPEEFRKTVMRKDDSADDMHLATAMMNLAFDFGLSREVTNPKDEHGAFHVSVHTNAGQTFTKGNLDWIFDSEWYTDANFQGAGVSMEVEYGRDKQFRQSVYEPVMHERFPDRFEYEKGEIELTDDLEERCQAVTAKHGDLRACEMTGGGKPAYFANGTVFCNSKTKCDGVGTVGKPCPNWAEQSDHVCCGPNADSPGKPANTRRCCDCTELTCSLDNAPCAICQIKCEPKAHSPEANATLVPMNY